MSSRRSRAGGNPCHLCLRIGPEIDPGVPWTTALRKQGAGAPLTLALKSGNFGSDDFFLKAWSRL
jgi:uncharacterized protein YgbK (DUF1537 family)